MMNTISKTKDDVFKVSSYCTKVLVDVLHMIFFYFLFFFQEGSDEKNIGLASNIKAQFYIYKIPIESFK